MDPAIQADTPQRIGNHLALAPVIEAKLSLMKQIGKAIQERWGTQQEAADALNMQQPDVSYLMNERHLRFSLDFLIVLAKRLDKKVTITVS